MGDDVNAQLDSNGLQNNGGPTKIIALQSTSPAIDAIPAADCPATDQRGVTGPDNGESACDVGAYEFVDTRFASFTVKLDLQPSTGSFNLNASFTLGSCSDGINPLNHNVTLQIGSYSATVPAGLFIPNKQEYSFQGTIAGVRLQIKITPQEDGSYTFQAQSTGANLTASPSSCSARGGCRG